MEIKCPKCNSTAFNKCGKTAKCTQRYLCKLCGYRFTEFSVLKLKNNIECYKCGSKNIKKNGFTRIRKQLYYCKDCGHKFVEFTKTRFLQKSEKELILKYHYGLGVSVIDIAKHLKRSTRTIYDFLIKHKGGKNEISK